MNVVGQWRERGRALRAEYWRCSHCGAFSAVRRAVCAQCERAEPSAPAKLPGRLRAVGWSRAHLAIENLDQTRAATAMLMEAPGGRRIPFLIADSDAAYAEKLVGQMLELVLRRAGDGGERDTIAYGRKVAANAHTRATILKSSDVSKKGHGEERE